MRVKRLPGKVNGAEIVRPVDIATLADERVTAQARLKPNLVPLASMEPHFDERGGGETLDDAILADGIFSARIARMSLLLDEVCLIPHQTVSPGSRRRRGMPVHDREIDALRLVSFELLFQA